MYREENAPAETRGLLLALVYQTSCRPADEPLACTASEEAFQDSSASEVRDSLIVSFEISAELELDSFEHGEGLPSERSRQRARARELGICRGEPASRRKTAVTPFEVG